jgi:hypothetical protein
MREIDVILRRQGQILSNNPRAKGEILSLKEVSHRTCLLQSAI